MSTRLLGIAAELSAPPSSPSVFRDLTLQAKIRLYDVIAICAASEVDLYVSWWRARGLMDFLDDVLPREQLPYLSVEIEGGQGAKLTAHNLHEVLAHL